MNPHSSKLAPIDGADVTLIERSGAEIAPLDPIGARVRGIDLSSATPPPAEVVDALERVMADRGFIVFESEAELTADAFLRASCWWGGKELHSTHGVHPATPDGNRHIFRLSNDRRHGILGVGPQWHNDGSFNTDTFSHSGYHIVRPAEKGGGTEFAHQGAAFDQLPEDTRELWSRLSSVNSTSGVVHPVVHEHPVSGRRCVWLHLGMTGAVIEKRRDGDGFREDPNGNRISLTLSTNSGNRERESIITLFAQEASGVGIEVTVNPIDFNALVGQLTSSYDWEMIVIGLTGSIDPITGVNVYPSDGALHMIEPQQESPRRDWEKRVDEAWQTANFTTDEEQRKEGWQTIQEIWIEELPWVFTYNAAVMGAYRSNWGNIFPHPIDGYGTGALLEVIYDKDRM